MQQYSCKEITDMERRLLKLLNYNLTDTVTAASFLPRYLDAAMSSSVWNQRRMMGARAGRGDVSSQ